MSRKTGEIDGGKGNMWKTYYFNMVKSAPTCGYCGDFVRTCGMDRFLSFLGYNVPGNENENENDVKVLRSNTKNNCIRCCKMCNQLKSSYCFLFFAKHIVKMVRYWVKIGLIEW